MTAQAKILPGELTSYDFLKTFAVVTMIIDHIGYFLFPEVQEFRAIGRMSLPIWMFLVGYASTRDIPDIMWIGGLVLMTGYFLVGHAILPLNILFAIIIVRSVIDTVMRMAMSNREYFMLTIIALFFLVLPTIFIFEYGTLGVLWAMTGYICRHQKEIGWSNRYVLGFFALVGLIYVVYQNVFFQFVIEDTMIMIACVATSAYFLMNFKAQTYQIWTDKLPNLVTRLLKFTGRKTLHIYVAHIFILMAISFVLFPEKYGLFHLKLY